MYPSYQPTSSYYHQESERLEFRALELSDIPLWLPFFEDEASLRFLGMNSPAFKDLSNEERATKWIERQIERKNNRVFGQLATIEKATGKLIGVSGLITRMEEDVYDELEVTYSLLPEARGKGFATELAIHFKKRAFEKTRIKSVISIIHVDNMASINVATKNGMHLEKKLDYMSMPVGIYRVARPSV